MNQPIKDLLRSLTASVQAAGMKIEFEHLLAFEYQKHNLRVGLAEGGCTPYFFVEDICEICKISNPVKQFMDVPDLCFGVSNAFSPFSDSGSYELVITEDAVYPLLVGSANTAEGLAFSQWMQKTVLKMAKEEFEWDPDGVLEKAKQKADEHYRNLYKAMIPILGSALKEVGQDVFMEASALTLAGPVSFMGVEVYYYVPVYPAHTTDFWMTNTQIGQLLGYADPNELIKKLHKKQQLWFDTACSQVRQIDLPSGGKQEAILYNYEGLGMLCDVANQSKASAVRTFLYQVAYEAYMEEWMRLAHHISDKVLPSLIPVAVKFWFKEFAEDNKAYMEEEMSVMKKDLYEYCWKHIRESKDEVKN